MTVTLKKDEKGKGERYRLEFWIDGDGKVEDSANAYPKLTRPAEGALPAQEAAKQVAIEPSVELRASIMAEVQPKVDAELAKS